MVVDLHLAREKVFMQATGQTGKRAGVIWIRLQQVVALSLACGLQAISLALVVDVVRPTGFSIRDGITICMSGEP